MEARRPTIRRSPAAEQWATDYCTALDSLKEPLEEAAEALAGTSIDTPAQAQATFAPVGAAASNFANDMASLPSTGTPGAADVKQQMLQGMMMGGDVAHLTEVATSDSNMDLRRQAIRQLGMLGAGRSGDTLVNIYNRQTDPAAKRAAVDGLFISGNAGALVALAKKETDRDLRRSIVEKLSIMNSPEAREYLLELLK